MSKLICENCGNEVEKLPEECPSCGGSNFISGGDNDSWVRKNRKTDRYVG